MDSSGSCDLLRSIKRLLAVILGLSFFVNLALLSVPLYTLQIFDRILASRSYDSLMMLFVGVSLVACLACVFEHLRRKSLWLFLDYLHEQIFPRVLDKLDETGENSETLLREFESIGRQLQSTLLLGVLDIMWLPLFIMVAFLIHPYAGLFIVLLNVSFGLVVFNKSRFQGSVDSQSLTRHKAFRSVFNITESTGDWLAFNGCLNRWGTLRASQLESNRREVMQTEVFHHMYSDLQTLLKWVLQLGLPTLGAVLLIEEAITAGGFLALLIVVSRSIVPFEAVFTHGHSLTSLYEVMKNLSRWCDVNDNIAFGFDADIKGSLCLKSVKTTLEGVADGLTMQCQPGEITVLLGGLGSGQADAMDVLLGRKQIASGSYLVDGIRLDDWSKPKLAEEFAFYSGSSRLPSVGIDQLLSRFDRSNKKDVLMLADMMGLNDKLIDLKIGYADEFQDAWLRTVHGRGLQQLIGLTSAFASSARVIFLENPEAFLDHDSLCRLAKTIGWLKRCQGKTLVITTQSRFIYEVADQIVVFDKGSVRYCGEPSALIDAGMRRNITGDRA